ncbi:MAG: alpha/beta hydrolase, partial [Nanoarchaeota archaeon]|nr:alpha/beta hydrolase [Nanoarchaeota archaeon]
EKHLKQTLQQKIESDINSVFFINSSISVLTKNLNELNKVVETNYSKTKLNETSTALETTMREFKKILELWSDQNYLELNRTFSDFNTDVSSLKSSCSELNQSVYSNISSYNSLILNLSDFKNQLEILSLLQYNESQALELEEIILSFNERISLFENERNLEAKTEIADEILKTDLPVFLNETENGTFINQPIYFNLTLLDFVQVNATENFSLIAPSEKCCVFNSCRDCCEICSSENYPIIFVHGYAFNYGLSAEFSVNIFDKLQDRLDSDGYINAGEIYYAYKRSNIPGILGLSNVPLTFRSSYYFDVLQESDGYIPVQMKSENIDTYAIRLKEIIEDIKFQTGKNRVRIVAHSMGGLVTRRYIQIFGNESVDRVILVAVPNHGISGSIEDYCSVLGSSLECRDMDKDSIFMNKLNSQPAEKVLTYNIVPSGCEMDSGDGDGIVLAESSYLATADKNFFITGTCSGFELLHGTVLNPEIHPEVVTIIKNSLNNYSLA